MIEIFEAMDSGDYDTWILLACWLAIMVVVWPAIIQLVLWWQQKENTHEMD